MSKKSNPDPL